VVKMVLGKRSTNSH